MIRTLVALAKETAPALEPRLATMLREAVFARLEADAPQSALEALVAREDFDVFLIERTLLPRSPRALLGSIVALPEGPGVIVLAPDENPGERAELLAAGALAVLWLGLPDDVLGTTLVSLAERRSEDVLERLSAARAESRSSLDEFVSNSPVMRGFLELARRVVTSDSALLILGETGVGKERLARSVHAEGRRRHGPFVTVHCGALPETLLETELFGHEKGAFTGAVRARRGFFELAHQGTIFLDEIGEMPLHLQVKLLRALEDQRIYRVGSERAVEVDVRIMAATNRDLKREMEEARFRSDLYYRLAVVSLRVPPLRDRIEDVPELAQLFLERSRHKLGRRVNGFSPAAMDAMKRHDWPGNVRELINVVERGALLATSETIRVTDLKGGDAWQQSIAPVKEPADGKRAESEPSASRTPSPTLEQPFSEARRAVVEAFERSYVEALLRATEGRIGEGAERAGLNERTLYSLMKRHGLRKEDYRPPSGGSR